MIDDEASNIIKTNEQDNIDLQNKIILSISVRLKAEAFMFGRLSENENRNFGSNQTRELFKKVENRLGEGEEIKGKEIIRRVLILATENIHINSFMYEPILDTSLEHLIECYKDLEALPKL